MSKDTLTQTPCTRCGKPCPEPPVLNISRRSAPSALAAASKYCSTDCMHADVYRSAARLRRCDECGKHVPKDNLIDAQFCSQKCHETRERNRARAWKLAQKGRAKLGRTESELEESYRLLCLIAPEIGRDEHALRGQVLRLMEMCSERHRNAVDANRRDQAHAREQRAIDRENAARERWTKKNQADFDASLAKRLNGDNR